jgi:hypothetical protein
MGGMSGSFGGLGDAITGVAEVAAAPETGGASLLPLAAQVGSSALSAGLNYAGTQDQISAAQQNQASANAFSANQFATRYQTTVKDLQAAGLNPMLAYSQGGGSPPTAQAAPTYNKFAGASGHIGDAAQKALGAANIAMDTQQKNANVTNTVANTTLTEQQAKLVDAQAQKTAAEAVSELMRQPGIPYDIKLKMAQIVLTGQQAKTSSAQEAATRQNIVIQEPEAWASKAYGHTKQGVKDVTTGVTSALNARNAAKGKPPVNVNPTTNIYEAP